jgi:group I intron endonuclease
MSDIKILKAVDELTTMIYSLVDPETNIIRYIGKSDNLNRRLSEHIKKSKHSITHKNNWIVSLTKKGLSPIIEVIDIVPRHEWEFWEVFWIDQFKSWGFNLTNISNGGNGGDLGPIVRKKISDKLKGRVNSEESKKKLSEYRLGKTYEELYGIERALEVKSKMSNDRSGSNNNMYGKTHSDVTKMKIRLKNSENNKGENNPMYGKKHTKDTIEVIKNKLSVKNSGVGNPFYGKTHTDEFKNKLRKKVKQLDLDGNLIKIWNSITEAANTLGLNQSSISSVCNKPNRTYNNYKWEKIN